MCGIAGIVDFNGRAPTRSAIEQMTRQMIARGPDSEGYFLDEHAALGHRRLSIIDLASGDQPIFNEARDKVIILNGEIYNYRELREKLLAAGHRFGTQSDTEVILHGYEEWGLAVTEHLRGMFAFAIWDQAAGELFLARDRLGEKPLYYCQPQPGRLLFASELKGVRAALERTPAIDQDALCAYLALTYIPAPQTIFQDVHKLEQASVLRFSSSGLTTKRYWDLLQLRQAATPLTDYREIQRQLRQLVEQAVESQLVADVPVGAFLSGGIDSSIVVGTMAKLSPRPVSTFTIGYREKEYDESKRAQAVADLYRPKHHCQYLCCDDALDFLEHIILNYDEPFADSSSLPTFFVSKLARSQVKVALTGDGGDELFGGYSKYLIYHYLSYYRRVPSLLRRRLFEPMVRFIPKAGLRRQVSKVMHAARLREPAELHLHLMELGIHHDELARLLAVPIAQAPIFDKIKGVYRSAALDPLASSMFTDLSFILEGDMLTKVDRASMLNSLETRVPFLDKHLVEFSLRVPSTFKIRGRQTKFILKDTFAELLPPANLHQPKSGFGVPIGRWLAGPLREQLLRLTSREFVSEQGIFNYEDVRRRLDAHLSGHADNSFQLWTLFVFQLWHAHHFGGQDVRLAKRS